MIVKLHCMHVSTKVITFSFLKGCFLLWDDSSWQPMTGIAVCTPVVLLPTFHKGSECGEPYYCALYLLLSVWLKWFGPNWLIHQKSITI